jgi:hypothetical protein
MKVNWLFMDYLQTVMRDKWLMSAELSDFGLPPKGVTNAQVTLITESGVRIPIFQCIGNGDYELWGFWLKREKLCLRSNLDGNTYLSNFEKVPVYSAEDRLSFAFSTEPINK